MGGAGPTQKWLFGNLIEIRKRGAAFAYDEWAKAFGPVFKVESWGSPLRVPYFFLLEIFFFVSCLPVSAPAAWSGPCCLSGSGWSCAWIGKVKNSCLGTFMIV